jgi:hypothetical protein
LFGHLISLPLLQRTLTVEIGCFHGLFNNGISVVEVLEPFEVYLLLFTNSFSVQKAHVLPTQCIYVFCVDLRTNSDYIPIQH